MDINDVRRRETEPVRVLASGASREPRRGPELARWPEEHREPDAKVGQRAGGQTEETWFPGVWSDSSSLEATGFRGRFRLHTRRLLARGIGPVLLDAVFRGMAVEVASGEGGKRSVIGCRNRLRENMRGAD